MANRLQKIGVLIGNILYFTGLWQLDLLSSPRIWDKNIVFLLPFNIPINGEIAYCLFYAMIMIGAVLVNLAYWFWE